MAGRVIKQGTFTCMLLLSTLLVYAVSIAGVQAGRLKKDISWAHPLFVALFNREYVSVPDAGDAENAVVENAGIAAAPTEEMQKVTETAGTSNYGNTSDALEKAESFTEANENMEDDADSDSMEFGGMYVNDAVEGASHDADSDEAENVIGAAYEAESRSPGAVEYAKRDMRYARSRYYNDSDIIALSSKLDYVQVDNEYFTDACFIGDSRIEGLYFYGGLKEADYFYKPGTTVYDMMDSSLSCNGSAASYIDVQTALSQRRYGKIFIMVGVNELGDKTPEEYAQAYANNIERIRELQPDASIFIMGMMHVTTGYSDASDVFNNDNIDNRNTAVAGLADGEMVFYLDMNECVGDECGGVREEYSYDGVHLKAEYYKLWTEWMKAHGINKLIK